MRSELGDMAWKKLSDFADRITQAALRAEDSALKKWTLATKGRIACALDFLCGARSAREVAIATSLC